ncbi:MAG: N-glycosylase/DNA lyase [Candidatus Binatia bacterium]|jgi:N-glycosylase/DNA lyase
MSRASTKTTISVREYDLAATLNSGQAFRWNEVDGGWEAVIAGRWVRLRETPRGIAAEAGDSVEDWNWLRTYLQTDVRVDEITASFPDDEPMSAAVEACRGLRLLRQDFWECLASFILSSNKQILQIRQMVAVICKRFGERVPSGKAGEAAFAFPAPERLAQCSEAELRECKLGYRAPYLRDSARMIAEGDVVLDELPRLTCDEARAELIKLPGVGPKIADCALLFAGGFQEAFPIDVWILKALKELYFAKKRNVTPKRIREFSDKYFGPNGGYAQQYLFHYMRKTAGRA